MIDPKTVAECDQATKMLADSMPPFWWSLFQNCIDQGFTRQEALKLVMCWINEFKEGAR